ncbi:hypothetical protein BATDEDRAFT_92603 [Batrachochytrium dendrobatidis JAM81]|uniref:Uncharacterized protein n=1 Tax=Batrachochytrium dendrobatidis (strain JAM81 / FGSC 10211) TaxID=684364 RepID=F4PE69_BATDJ|nr:uncharacterized protein BATDEDRAFT_92603 [Batrachochytrium dendrobatidis JAM81]EGF76600.1 hypothetical protein BATDEDRAFT_92603 [Batrachochytrium dendrobatidis JAM81]KAJ8331872.1 hypothetical protein O5D80_000173 [Batrachochytrium dendrobatidis]KAK5672609.1 hypothetical protein QVD99_000128 [Batrachochytrium dendrobatidis]|eukprot:XP_006682927.1 hypothetical protein BATDEDRAFT_92603 [Batrachochytrium dendrobatidis JAM81]
MSPVQLMRLSCHKLVSVNSVRTTRIPTLTCTRSFINFPKKIPLVLTKRDVDIQVLELLHNYANDSDKVTMNANMIKDLLMDRYDRFGFYTDLIEKFDIDINPSRRFSRDLASAREASDWAASFLEQDGRLIF